MHGGSGSSPTYLSSPTHPIPYGSASDSYSSLGNVHIVFLKVKGES